MTTFLHDAKAQQTYQQLQRIARAENYARRPSLRDRLVKLMRRNRHARSHKA